MAVGGYGNNGIVTDGLILSVDPYNRKSYVSGGTVYDLTTNKYTGETINGVGYDNAWNLDGTNQVVSINSELGLLQPSLPITIDFWVRVNAFNGGGLVTLDSTQSNNYYGASVQLNAAASVALSLGDGIFNGTGNRRTLLTPNNSLSTGEWYHIVGIFRDAVTTDITGYINLVDVGGTPSGGGAAVAWSNNVNARTYLGESWGLGSNYADADISQVKVYNRELSFSEITQNNKALKWRFI
jgi:hypothetical protein